MGSMEAETLPAKAARVTAREKRRIISASEARQRK